MSMEDFTNTTDAELLESARLIAAEAERRGLRLTRSLGELASNGAAEVMEDRENRYEEVDPFLEPGSPAAKAYARQDGASGRPRWMEQFSKTDMFGRPTVFSDGYDPTDRGI